jgi:uncharacterized SAM-binding protein YcdF (DUF218 family)
VLIAVKILLHTLLLPPGGLLLLAALGVFLVRWRHGAWARSGWTLLAASLAVLWLLSMPVVAEQLGRAAERYPALDLSKPVSAQAIVVIGGYAERMHAPEFANEPAVAANLLGRITYTAFLAQRLHLPVLVSGSPEETAAMCASLARFFNISVRWSERHSRDTFENARFSAALLRADGVSRILLVTDGAHEWRAAHEFASAGLAVIPAPEGLWGPHKPSDLYAYVPTPQALVISTAALYEMIGDLARRAFAALGVRRQLP